MKPLILFLLGILLMFGCATNAATIEKIDDDIKISVIENATIQSAEISKVAETHMPKVTILSSLESAECAKPIYHYEEPLYEPQYYIFSPTLNGKDCLCPSGLYYKGSWEYYMFGYLYEPTKTYNVSTGFVDYDKCLATNCYTSGLQRIGTIRYPTPSTNWTVSYRGSVYVYLDDEIHVVNFDQTRTEADVEGVRVIFKPEINCPKSDSMVVYNTSVKNMQKFMDYDSSLRSAKTNFRYRIEARDTLVTKMNDFLKDSISGCKVDGQLLACIPDKKSTQTEVYLNIPGS